jgi:hypothetical protein
MAAVPIYVWNGTAWQETGPTIPANPIKYQASAPSSPSTGDIWVDSDADVTTGSQQFQRFRFVASGGETTISGNDANGATLAYTAGLEQVVLNGAVLVRGHDYTATNGTSITGLSPALVANDVLEVFSFIAFTVANTYTQSQVDGLVAAAGKVKQIVYGSYGTQINSSTNTYVDTGLTATITPTSATSKILVMIAHGANQKETNNTSMAMRLYRGATSIAQIMVDGGKDGGTGRNDFGGTNINVLDEPATTSATTYKTQFMSQGNNAVVCVQTGNSLSTIILMEIGV